MGQVLQILLFLKTAFCLAHVLHITWKDFKTSMQCIYQGMKKDES